MRAVLLGLVITLWGFAPCLAAEVTITLPGDVPMKFGYVPPGTFWMGSPEDERGHQDDEDLHQVMLTEGIFVGVTEVTQGQWEALTGNNPSDPDDPTSCTGSDLGVGPGYPVTCVSWDDIAGAGGFVELLNDHLTTTAQTGAGMFRLPTEAEWERAARGGTETEFSFATPPGWDLGCGSLPEAAPFMWWCWNSNDPSYGSKPVGSKLANPYGLRDMHGNVNEFVQDWFQEHLGSDTVVDPTGPETGLYRVFRSGSWNDGAASCRSASRSGLFSFLADDRTGFRLVRFAPDYGTLFVDGFESGDTSRWSVDLRSLLVSVSAAPTTTRNSLRQGFPRDVPVSR